MDIKDVIETIDYIIKDIENGMEDSAINELIELKKQLEESN
jgi:hypothetical protein